MNVQNRKLFRNKDARRQLAAMGGIMRSSPELAGEAARFAEGGTARERAISGQGALDEFASSSRTPIDLRAIDRALGSRVQDMDRRVQTAIVSFLGNVFQVVGDRIFHSDTGVEIEEPSLKREILTQGDRIAAEDMAMAQDVPQGQPSVFAQPEGDVTPAPAAPTMEDIIAARSIAENQGGPMGEAAAALAGMTPQNQSEDLVTFYPQGLFSPSMGRSMYSAPYDVSRLAEPKIDDSQISTDALIEQAKGLLSPEAVSRIESGDVAGTIENSQIVSLPEPKVTTVVDDSMPAPEMAQSNLPEINVTPSSIKTMSDSGLTLPAPPQGRVGDMPIEELIDFSTPSEALASETLLRNRAESAAIENEMDDALDPIVPFNTEGGRATALGEETAATKEALDAEVAVSPLQEAAREALYPQRAREFREQEANRTNLPLIGGSDSEIIKAIEEKAALEPTTEEDGDRQDVETVRPKPRPKELENAYAAALAAAEASTNPDASLPDTIGANLGEKSSSSIEEATKAQYKFLKDFLGVGERDKQKEFNLMAMQFFTALAAGQSPNALANLNAAASTAIAGLAAGDKERTALDRDLKLAAYEQALAEEGRKEDRADKNFRAYLSAGFVPIIDPLTKQITGFKSASKQKVSPYEPFVDQVVNMAKAAMEEGRVPKGMNPIDYAIRDLTPLYKSQGLPVGNYELKKDPKVEDLIDKERNKGKTDAQIKAMIVDAGIDPAVYGM
jgi:hypothetical protein